MKLKNTTEIPNDKIREVIQFVRPSGIKNFDVMVRNGEYLAGRAYTQGSGYHSTASPFVVCRVPKEAKTIEIISGGIFRKQDTPNYPRKLKTYQIGQLKGRRYYLADRIEALVYIMAHELRHIWQGKSKNKAGYFWGSRGRFSEIDTESYAIHMLRAWRKEKHQL